MKEINLNYLEENFLTLEQIASRTDISAEVIKSFINKKITPEPSYIVRQIIEITSPLEDKHEIEEVVWYFPESYVELLKASQNKSAENLKQSFVAEMRRHLLGHSAKEFAYGNVFESGGKPNEEKLAGELENEWRYYNQGIYGICTLHAIPREIIEKEIAVKKLLNALDTFSAGELINRKSEISLIIDEFDKVSNLFAPYQRESNSRGKYVDKILKHLGMEEKVKTYGR